MPLFPYGPVSLHDEGWTSWRHHVGIERFDNTNTISTKLFVCFSPKPQFFEGIQFHLEITSRYDAEIKQHSSIIICSLHARLTMFAQSPVTWNEKGVSTIGGKG